MLNLSFRSIIHRIAQPVQKVQRRAETVIRLQRESHLIQKGWKSLWKKGPRHVLKKAKRALLHADNTRFALEHALFSRKELRAQRKCLLPRNIKFDILIPLKTVVDNEFREMILSLKNQTYSNWELYLVVDDIMLSEQIEKAMTAWGKKDGYSKILDYKQLVHDSKGDYFVFMRQEDLLHPAALHEIAQSICDLDADLIYTDENTFHTFPDDADNPYFKPAFSPDTLCGYNYIGPFISVKRELFEKCSPVVFDELQSDHYSLTLHLTEQANRVAHIPEILYYRRATSFAGNTTGKGQNTGKDAIAAVERHLERLHFEGKVSLLRSDLPYIRIRYALNNAPKISILIPNYEHLSDLKLCLESILNRTTYSNYEVVIVENNSSSTEIFRYYAHIQEKYSNIKVVVWDGPFNYPAINNYGVRYCSGEYILLLNNDIEVITPDWLQEMLMYGQREDVGAVGAKLLYSDQSIQHAGIMLGPGGFAEHYHLREDRSACGYWGRLLYVQNVAAVTGACLLVRRAVWEELNGLDPAFAVAINDVDFCMRVRRAGYLIVWTPFAELYHYESKSRGYEDTPEKKRRLLSEIQLFQTRWPQELAAGDPYYSPNFDLTKKNFTLKPKLLPHKAR